MRFVVTMRVSGAFVVMSWPLGMGEFVCVLMANARGAGKGKAVHRGLILSHAREDLQNDKVVQVSLYAGYKALSFLF